MKKDLHIHTNFSDGQYLPKEILSKIKQAGITEFAITDHDNFDGAIIMKDLIKDENIKYHIGVEISSIINGYNVHLLCYDFDVLNERAKEIIEDLKVKRLKKLDMTIDYVKKCFNYSITDLEKQKLLEENHIVGKPHIYAYLSKKMNLDREEFYNKMNDLKCENTKVDASKVINAFHNAGGKVVLAHPKEIEEEYDIDSFKIIEVLAKKGIDGLETKHSKHTYEDYIRYKIYAKKFNLFETQGSDFHGEKVKPNVKLGECKKPEKIDENIL